MLGTVENGCLHLGPNVPALPGGLGPLSIGFLKRSQTEGSSSHLPLAGPVPSLGTGFLLGAGSFSADATSQGCVDTSL